MPSILDHGLLCHRLAQGFAHRSIALADVQDRRARIRLPNGVPLHNHVNLYFNPRNPMMYKRQEQHESLCILVCDACLLDYPDTWIADRNAAASGVRFLRSPDGLAELKEEPIFARYWTHPDATIQAELKALICAELLVPNQVPSICITKALVSCMAGWRALKTRVGNKLAIAINSYQFFR